MDIGFIGLGNMGGPMASNILKAGHSLTVHDLNYDSAIELLGQGASWADSPRDVARNSAITFTSLPSPVEMTTVALGPDGILDGAQPNSVYIDLTSNSPTVVRDAYNSFKEKGVHMMDAPVFGSLSDARAGRLVIMVGGDEGVLERCRPVLNDIGAHSYYAGSAGCGCICKLVNNCIFACQRVALIECLTLGIKAGVDPKRLWETVQGGILAEPNSGGLVESLFRGDFEHKPDLPSFFSLKLLRKDVGLATQLARQHEVPVAMASLCEQELINAMNQGWGEENSMKFLTLQEERAGVKVRISNVETDVT